MTEIAAKTRVSSKGAPARQAPPFRLLLRQVHLYLGALVAPSVLFFALTGMLQLFSLHEAHGEYRPLPVIEKLGRLHKDQVYALRPKPKAPAPTARLEAPAQRRPASPKPQILALKIFFFGVGGALVLSTLLGIWIGVTQSRRRAVVLAVLAAGLIFPLLLVVLS